MNNPPAGGNTSRVMLILTHTALVDVLYPHLSVSAILNLELVCRAIRSSIKGTNDSVLLYLPCETEVICHPIHSAWLPIAYNINRHLARYFDDPKSFRRLQAQTGALISGSNALQFFDRAYYPDSDIDLYVSCWHARQVAIWLEHHKYVYRPNLFQRNMIKGLDENASYPPIFHGVEDGVRISGAVDRYLQAVSAPHLSWREMDDAVEVHESYDFRGIKSVLSFISAEPDKDGGPRQKVDIIVATGQSTPLACILNFHSTLVMNFIGYDMAYSLFPDATFLRRKCLTFNDTLKTKLVRDRIYSKYRDRGFDIAEFATPMEYLSPANSTDPKRFRDKHTGVRFQPRFVGDRLGWRIPLDTAELLNPGEEDEAAFQATCLRSHGFSLIAHPTGPNTSLGDGSVQMEGVYPHLGYRVIGSDALENMLVLPFEDFRGVLPLLSTQEAMIWHFLKLMTNETNRGFDQVMAIENRAWDKDVLQVLQKIAAYNDSKTT